MKKLVALVPTATNLEPECEASLQKLRQKGVPVRVLRGASAIDAARSQMAHDALHDGFTELMWIDADIAFEPDDIEKLSERNLPFVCGIYPKKNARALACHVMPGTTEIIFGEEGGLMEILYASGGFTLVRKEVYDAVKEHSALPLCNAQFGAGMIPYYQPFVHESEKGPWYLAEDFAFSERARRAGFSIWADTRIRLRHIGRYAFQWEDAGSPITRQARYRINMKP